MDVWVGAQVSGFFKIYGPLILGWQGWACCGAFSYARRAFWSGVVFSNCVKRVTSLAAVRGLLIAVASLVVERGLSSRMARGLACPRAWNLPGPGTEPVPSALAAGFFNH